MKIPIEQYVLVNESWGPGGFGGTHFILPGEEPHTFVDLVNLLYEAVDVMEEHSGHTLGSSLRVYRLVEVPIEELEEPLLEARKQWEEDNCPENDSLEAYIEWRKDYE